MRKAGAKIWLFVAVTVLGLLVLAGGISYWATTGVGSYDSANQEANAKLDEADLPESPPVYDTLAPYKGGTN